MKLKDYVFSKAYTLSFLALACLLLCVFMAIADTGTGLTLAAAGCFVLLVTAWVFTGFTVQKKRMEELEKTLSQLDEKFLLGEVLPEPKNEAEAYYFKIVKDVSRSCIGEVQRARHDKDEYCEYVENWIHELKTPLTACSLILENGADAVKLRRELKSADNLTACILYYARMKDAGKDTLIRSFSAADVINSAVKDQMSLLIAAGISVETQGDFIAESDDKALSFIIGQLLVNSAKYCPGCKIRIDAADGVIVYEDNGAGIPAHELPRVTERGFTGTNGRNTGSSTGMGLYIVNGLCEHLGIDLKIESERNEFTRFTLSFASLTKM